MGYLLLCPFRGIGQNPDRILAPYLSDGMTVLEVGPGMGFFTLPMARMVGPAGKIVCVDLQEEMLAAVHRRAAKAGVAGRIEARACHPTTLGIGDLAGKVDFVLLFAVVHEVRDTPRLFHEIVQVMKPGARCLVAEPKFHVSVRDFEQTIASAAAQGLRLVDRPVIWGSRSAVLSLV
jgi:ubiquinone/menaquinone biosynthesis C-methylase UbiE